MTNPEPRPLNADRQIAVPPQNAEAELAVLGSVLLDRDVIGRVAPLVEVRDFWTPRHALIYEAMLTLDARGERADYLTLLTELERTGRLAEVGGGAFLGSLIEHVPTPIHAEQYAGLVAQAGFMRRLIQTATRMLTLGYENAEDVETTLARCDQLMAEMAASGPNPDFLPILAGLQAYLEQLGAASVRDLSAPFSAGRVPTTYRDLDRYLGGGFSRGDLIMLAGRPAMGKSSLGMEIVGKTALTYGAKVAVFSLEMGVSQLLARMVSTTSGIPLTTLDTARISDAEKGPLGEAFGRLAEIDVVLDDAGTQTIAGIRSKVRRQAMRAGLDLVVVDHIQMVTAPSPRQNRVDEMGAISRGLKALAREQNVAVLAISQLSRAAQQRTDKRPQLSDLRDSGSLEQDADVVLGLYRDEYYNPDTERTRIADVLVLKNRNGPTGDCSLIWNPETTGFRGMEAYDGRG
jgi:replicative DNA helicase